MSLHSGYSLINDSMNDSINDSMNDSTNSSFVGVHLLVNVYGVTNIENLEWLTKGKPLLDEIVKNNYLNVVSETGHQFNPVGYSYAYVLSESHFTIHTYPEFSSCYIDIFCCNPSFNTDRAIRIIKQVYQTEQVRHHIIRR
jgi:S-adenosylmethionine decarboxylase proenzyme